MLKCHTKRVGELANVRVRERDCVRVSKKDTEQLLSAALYLAQTKNRKEPIAATIFNFAIKKELKY